MWHRTTFRFKNCKCKKKSLVDKFVEECTENNDGNEMIYNDTSNGCEK